MRENKCFVGNDSDSGVGAVIIAVIVVCIIIAVIVYGGLFIGGYHALANYFISLKHNLYDSNRKVSAA